MADIKRYNLAQFVFDGEQIRTGEFSTTRKISAEKLKACNSHTPYATMFAEEEFEWELKDVDPIFRPFFDNVVEKQKASPDDLAMISTFDYSEITGDLVEDDTYTGVWVEEIGKDTANKPFTVKGAATRKLPK